ncbi:hypothetical protein BC829DRAFT_382745, partial [Chytridium lagenaria]
MRVLFRLRKVYVMCCRSLHSSFAAYCAVVILPLRNYSCACTVGYGRMLNARVRPNNEMLEEMLEMRTGIEDMI